MFGNLSAYGYMWWLDELYPPYIGAPGGPLALAGAASACFGCSSQPQSLTLASDSNPQPTDPKS
jgi:hypothetical protein